MNLWTSRTSPEQKAHDVAELVSAWAEFLKQAHKTIRAIYEKLPMEPHEQDEFRPANDAKVRRILDQMKVVSIALHEYYVKDHPEEGEFVIFK